MRTSPERWLALWTRIGARGDGLVWHKKLCRAYQEKHRHYHTLQHLDECLTLFDTLVVREAVTDSRALELALWFHDSVYEIGASTNEEQSSQLAKFVLFHAGAASTLIDDTSRLIMVTKNHQASSEDERWMLDLDLSILGQTPQRFQEYEQQIRLEYYEVDEAIYQTRRFEIMVSFLNRPRLFNTAYCYCEFEVAARRNLKWLLSYLTNS